MKQQMPEVDGKQVSAETPDDVAALYAWADIRGIKYHDFSAARRAFRAHLRERSAAARGEAEARATAAEVAQASAGGSLSVTAANGLAGGPDRGAAVTLAGQESMLPQRFPRRRRARELAPGMVEAPEPRASGTRASALDGSLIQSSHPSGLAALGRLPNGAGSVIAGHSGQRSLCGREGANTDRSAIAARDAAVSVPAWIDGEAGGAKLRAIADAMQPRETRTSASSPVVDTLQHSRERVASRWYALRGVFDPSAPAMEPTQAHTRQGGSPVIGLFSLAGGVGKTSLTAALGRALSALGEKVLLADITAHGLLPFYFGSQELPPGMVRKFLPPPGSAELPVSLVTVEVSGTDGDMAPALAHELRSREDFDRIIVDLSPAAISRVKELLQIDAVMLVPVAPDMNSVIGLAAVERFFAVLSEETGRVIQPKYLLTQFDSALPLHLDVREVMRQQLGDRLLPLVIRRAPEVAEALAEGMTVIDYAPESGVVEDYRDLADWIRTFTGPAPYGPKNARRS